MIALGALVVLCLVGLLVLCASSDRARDVADRALEEAVLVEGRLRTELATVRAALVESERRRAIAVEHVHAVRADLRETEVQRLALDGIANDLTRQRDAARSEAARAQHGAVVIRGPWVSARGGDA